MKADKVGQCPMTKRQIPADRVSLGISDSHLGTSGEDLCVLLRHLHE